MNKPNEEVLNTPSAGEAPSIIPPTKEISCPKCGSRNIESGYIESAPGYGAGPNFKFCEECGGVDYE